MLGESLHDLVGAPKEELIHHLVADRPELRRTISVCYKVQSSVNFARKQKKCGCLMRPAASS